MYLFYTIFFYSKGTVGPTQASYPPTGSSSMTTASGISMVGQPHASSTSTTTQSRSTIAAASSEGQDNNTKEKLSLSKTNSDETEVEKNPRPSQPLRPSCLSPQAKE